MKTLKLALPILALIIYPIWGFSAPKFGGGGGVFHGGGSIQGGGGFHGGLGFKGGGGFHGGGNFQGGGSPAHFAPPPQVHYSPPPASYHYVAPASQVHYSPQPSSYHYVAPPTQTHYSPPPANIQHQQIYGGQPQPKYHIQQNHGNSSPQVIPHNPQNNPANQPGNHVNYQAPNGGNHGANNYYGTNHPGNPGYQNGPVNGSHVQPGHTGGYANSSHYYPQGSEAHALAGHVMHVGNGYHAQIVNNLREPAHDMGWMIDHDHYYGEEEHEGWHEHANFVINPTYFDEDDVFLDGFFSFTCFTEPVFYGGPEFVMFDYFNPQGYFIVTADVTYIVIQGDQVVATIPAQLMYTPDNDYFTDWANVAYGANLNLPTGDYTLMIQITYNGETHYETRPITISY